jgi:hypothetical protein
MVFPLASMPRLELESVLGVTRKTGDDHNLATSASLAAGRNASAGAPLLRLPPFL